MAAFCHPHARHRHGCGVILLALALWLPFPAISNTLPITGTLTQGGLAFLSAPVGSTVSINGVKAPVLEDGRAILAFDRDAPLKQTIIITEPDGGKQQSVLNLTERKYDIQRIDGLPEDKVTPPRSAALQKRINREVAEINKARGNYTQEPLFDTGWVWPVTGTITGVFGSQRVLNGQPRRPHYGVDIAAPTGTPVKAPADGIVRLVQDDNYFSGGTLFIDHGYSVMSAFLHMHSISVKPGQKVKQGDVIGTVGSTGRSTGAHLDWRVNVGKAKIDAALLAGDMMP